MNPYEVGNLEPHAPHILARLTWLMKEIVSGVIICLILLLVMMMFGILVFVFGR